MKTFTVDSKEKIIIGWFLSVSFSTNLSGVQRFRICRNVGNYQCEIITISTKYTNFKANSNQILSHLTFRIYLFALNYSKQSWFPHQNICSIDVYKEILLLVIFSKQFIMILLWYLMDNSWYWWKFIGI